jgi:hypothetical protein
MQEMLRENDDGTCEPCKYAMHIPVLFERLRGNSVDGKDYIHSIQPSLSNDDDSARTGMAKIVSVSLGRSPTASASAEES